MFEVKIIEKMQVMSLNLYIFFVNFILMIMLGVIE